MPTPVQITLPDSGGRGVALSAGQQVGTASLPVVLASDQDAAATGARSSVAASASSVQLLAANAARVKGGVVIVNESAATLYLSYGATASTTSYTYPVAPNAVWEMPSNVRYTGRIDGIWSSATGNARITELTP